MTRYWDISPILNNNTPRYEGDPQFDLEPIISPDGWQISKLIATTHSGSHFDFPRHFFAEGKAAASFSPINFIGACRVVDVSDGAIVDAEFVRSILPLPKRVIFKSGGKHWNGIVATGAGALADAGLCVVGTDSLGIEETEADFPVHKALLSQNVVILENLELNAVSGGDYIFVGLPLRIEAGDGSPVRVILVHPEDWARLIGG